MLLEVPWLETSEETPDGGVKVGSMDEGVSLDTSEETLWLDISEETPAGVVEVGSMDEVASLDSSEGTPVEDEELSSKAICGELTSRVETEE